LGGEGKGLINPINGGSQKPTMYLGELYRFHHIKDGFWKLGLPKPVLSRCKNMIKSYKICKILNEQSLGQFKYAGWSPMISTVFSK